MRKNGQSGTFLLLATNHGVSKTNKKTHGTTTSRSYQMTKDSPSSLPLLPPDLTAMQLPEKLVDQTKVIIPFYSLLILWDMCQEWDWCNNNITHLTRRTTTIKTLKHRRRSQFPLHLLPLVGATSPNASDTMHQHARQNASQTQTSDIESCQQPIWQRYTSISTKALKMTLTSISLLTLTKMIEWGMPTSHASGYAPCRASSTTLQKERKE